jgi:hypothetical protein
MALAKFRTLEYDNDRPHVRVYRGGWVVGIAIAVEGMETGDGTIQIIEAGKLHMIDENGVSYVRKNRLMPLVEIDAVSFDQIRWVSENQKNDYLNEMGSAQGTDSRETKS